MSWGGPILLALLSVFPKQCHDGLRDSPLFSLCVSAFASLLPWDNPTLSCRSRLTYHLL